MICKSDSGFELVIFILLRLKRKFLIILAFNERIMVILIKYKTTELSRINSLRNITIRIIKLKKENICISVTMRLEKEVVRTLIRNRCYSIKSIWQIYKNYWNSEWKFKLYFSYLLYIVTIRILNHKSNSICPKKNISTFCSSSCFYIITFKKYVLYNTNILRQNNRYAINILYYLIFKKCFELNHITNLDI